MALEKTLISRVYQLDHIYGLLLTFGLMMFIQGTVRLFVRDRRPSLSGAAGTARRLRSRLHVPAEVSRLGGAGVARVLLRHLVRDRKDAARPHACAPPPKIRSLTRAFGINVPALLTFGFGVGVALAGAAGVLAAPIYSVSPLMGGDLVIVVFAVVVVGGMGSILGSIVTGLSLGLLEGPDQGVLSARARTW